MNSAFFIEVSSVLLIASVAEVSRVVMSQVNLALNKPAFQMHTRNSGIASKAVDGNRNSNWYGESCIDSIGENPWWAVDLMEQYLIVGVNLTSRGDCCNRRVNRFIVGLTNSQPQEGTSLPLYGGYTLCGQYPGVVAAGATVYQPCVSDRLKYRYVVIQADSALTGENVTSICEVEVYGFRDVPTTADITSIQEQNKQLTAAGGDSTTFVSRNEKMLNICSHSSSGECLRVEFCVSLPVIVLAVVAGALLVALVCTVPLLVSYNRLLRRRLRLERKPKLVHTTFTSNSPNEQRNDLQAYQELQIICYHEGVSSISNDENSYDFIR